MEKVPEKCSVLVQMVMYTHQFGPRSGGLTVLVADRKIYPVWERGGALGDLWVKAEVEIVTSSVFQVRIKFVPFVQLIQTLIFFLQMCPTDVDNQQGNLI